MERSPQLGRQPSKLTPSLHRKLSLYTLAAGATGVAMLTGAQPAAAEIVYTPTHQQILTQHRLTLDLNHDGIADFAISNRAFCTTDICGRTLIARPLAPQNKVAGMKGLIFTLYASAFKPGAKIGGSAHFSGKLMAASGTEYGYVGQWQNVAKRYLGLKFAIAGQIHYGWARFSVKSGTGKITAILTGYAYETIANKPIIAGQSKGPTEIIDGPDAGLGLTEFGPAKLGLLALGSPALCLWRREEAN